MGAKIKVTTSREKLYAKDYKRDKFIKIKNIKSDADYAYEFLYRLTQYQNDKK